MHLTASNAPELSELIKRLCRLEILAVIATTEDRLNRKVDDVQAFAKSQTDEIGQSKSSIMDVKAAVAEIQERMVADDRDSVVEDVRALRQDVNKMMENTATIAQFRRSMDASMGFGTRPGDGDYMKLDSHIARLEQEKLKTKSELELEADIRSFERMQRQELQSDTVGRNTSTRRFRGTGEKKMISQKDGHNDSDSVENVESIAFHLRPLGPVQLGLDPLPSTNPQFDRLLNYRYYRLSKTTSKRSGYETGKVRD